MDQIGRLEAITYVPAKGEPGIQTKERKVSPEKGLEGDYHGLDGDSSLTIWTLEARNMLTEQHFAGICFQRFRENLSLSGIDLSSLEPGTRLQIKDAVLKIEDRRKRCHPDICPLTEDRKNCLLKNQCRYVSVEIPGVLVQYAPVYVKEKPVQKS